MNWKKLTIRITIINVLGWFLLELWSARYAESNVSAGAGWMIPLHLIGYYLIVVGSNQPKPKEPKPEITPATCPGHDWQKQEYGNGYHCVICKAKRGA